MAEPMPAPTRTPSQANTWVYCKDDEFEIYKKALLSVVSPESIINGAHGLPNAAETKRVLSESLIPPFTTEFTTTPPNLFPEAPGSISTPVLPRPAPEAFWALCFKKEEDGGLGLQKPLSQPLSILYFLWKLFGKYGADLVYGYEAGVREYFYYVSCLKVTACGGPPLEEITPTPDGTKLKGVFKEYALSGELSETDASIPWVLLAITQPDLLDKAIQRSLQIPRPVGHVELDNSKKKIMLVLLYHQALLLYWEGKAATKGGSGWA